MSFAGRAAASRDKATPFGNRVASEPVEAQSQIGRPVTVKL